MTMMRSESELKGVRQSDPNSSITGVSEPYNAWLYGDRDAVYMRLHHCLAGDTRWGDLPAHSPTIRDARSSELSHPMDDGQAERRIRADRAI